MGYGSKRNTKISSAWWPTHEVDLAVTKGTQTLTIGWALQSDGTYNLVADWYSTGVNQKQFVQDVKVGHTKHKATSWLKKRGYSVKYETDEAGDLVVVGTHW